MKLPGWHMPELIRPSWPAPASVKAVSTTRLGGVSAPPWNSFNLAHHVEDDPAAVRENRRRLAEAAGLPGEPAWLDQVHGTRIAGEGARDCTADGRFTTVPGSVCAVLTADCLPVLLCNEAGTAVAAVHAGWRGLLDGVIEAALDCFPDPPSAIMAWLGPAIGPDAFEVGDEVRQAFLQKQPGSGEAFSAHGTGKWLADLYRLAAGRLKARGVTGIYGGGYCTFTDSERFFSYRRDGRTGRMASLVWLDRGDDR